MSRIVVGIPTINRADLLSESLADIAAHAPYIDKLIIIDNGNQCIKIPEKIKNVEIHKPKKNQGCGGSWSMIMDLAFADKTVDHVLMPSDDVVMGKEFWSNLEQMYINYAEYDVLLPPEKLSWCVVSISRECWETVGRFDPIFWPAYYEDVDYMHRMSLVGKEPTHTEAMRPEVWRSGQSSAINANLIGQNTMEKFLAKWGPGRLRMFKDTNSYTEPYNGDVHQQQEAAAQGQRNIFGDIAISWYVDGKERETQ